MLPRYRRYFAVLGFLLLATPLVAGVVWPDNPELILKEGRRRAPAPTTPASWSGLLALPSQVDAYLRDRFGLRQKMIRLHKDLTKPLLIKENNVVVFGHDGRMFALGDDMVMQSAGRVLRAEDVSETADMLAAMRDALARRGIRFLVAMPPNSSTIYQDDLPLWARNPGRKTEYDLLLEALAARGVKAVDLRRPVSAARADGPTFLINDLHWTARGAIAGFNAVVEADGRPDWRIDAASALGASATRKGGDIALLLGVEDNVSEMSEPLVLPVDGRIENLSQGPMPDHVIISDRSGPTVMVIGDSFTTDHFPLMLSQHVGRAIWVHHQHCGFDWKLIDKLRPDEVWWAPVERFLTCPRGRRPIDFAG
jgi:alginate O-acetyltransferase complex protein AlgJ